MKQNLILLRSLFAPWWDIKSRFIILRYGLSKKFGLCYNYSKVTNKETCDKLFKNLIINFLSYKNIPLTEYNILYPVKGVYISNYTTYICTKDKYTGEYGKNRRELLEFMIEHCKDTE